MREYRTLAGFLTRPELSLFLTAVAGSTLLVLTSKTGLDQEVDSKAMRVELVYFVSWYIDIKQVYRL